MLRRSTLLRLSGVVAALVGSVAVAASAAPARGSFFAVWYHVQMDFLASGDESDSVPSGSGTVAGHESSKVSWHAAGAVLLGYSGRGTTGFYEVSSHKFVGSLDTYNVDRWDHVYFPPGTYGVDASTCDRHYSETLKTSPKWPAQLILSVPIDRQWGYVAPYVKLPSPVLTRGTDAVSGNYCTPPKAPDSPNEVSVFLPPTWIGPANDVLKRSTLIHVFGHFGAPSLSVQIQGVLPYNGEPQLPAGNIQTLTGQYSLYIHFKRCADPRQPC